MSTPAPSPTRTLQRPLDQIRRRLVLVAVSAGALWAVQACVVLLLVAAWLDLVWELSPAVRIAALTLAAVAAVATLSVFVARAASQARDANLVRRLDEAGRTGGVIVSGWELASARRTAVPMLAGENVGSFVTAQLADLAVAHASRVASRISPAQAVPLQPARRAATVTLGLLAAMTLFGVIFPGLVATQWARFFHPLRDVPPYSPLQFTVEPGDAQVIYGQGLDIHAEVTGRTVDRVELVLRSSAGEETLPMFQQPGGKWRTSLARITEAAQYLVRAGRARSPRFEIGVITVPQLELVRFKITPPAYTRDATYEGPLPKEGLAGLAGTEVQIMAKSNRPLSGGRVMVTQGDQAEEVRLQPLAAGADEVHGTLTIRAAGRFELRVVDAAGQESLDSLAGAITLLEDRRPLVRLIEPKPQSLATPSANLPVVMAAEDDFGLATAQLFRSLNDSRAMPLKMPLGSPPPRRFQGREYLPLSAYGLSPGDEIKLFARVEDNDPAGGKGAESPIAVVRIISQEEFERMVRTQQGLEVLISKYQQAERRMEALAGDMQKLQEKLKQAPTDSSLAEETRQQMQSLANEMQQQAKAVEAAQKQLLPYDLDQHLTEQLEQLAKELKAASEAVEKVASNKSATNKDAADALHEEAGRMAARRRQFQQEATQPLEHLAKIFPLLTDQARFVQLAMRQRDLADRMAALRGKDNVDDPTLRVRMRDLEEEQRRLRGELDELLQDIENHVAQLPDDPRLDTLRATARAFVVKVRSRGVGEVMLDAESALAEFLGTKGHDKAREAAEILESFLSQCNTMAGQCEGGLKFNPSLSRGLGKTLEQLLAGMGLGMGSGEGSGFGIGGGNGFSSRRGGMSNMGLYGGLPSMDAGPSGSGAGSSSAAADARGAVGEQGRDGDPALFDAARQGGTIGSSQGLIPPRYRKRVSEYFQRVAEEIRE